jgi:hypothetical protein
MIDELLNAFRSEVPLPGEETVRGAYASATAAAARSSPRTRLESPRLARPALVAVIAIVAALALVPFDSVSLGARAINSISGLWRTPANQPALDRAANDAQSLASGYYTDARVDDAANKVDLYLTHAPRPVLDRLQAAHPGTYVIHNHAAHTLHELLEIEHALSFTALRSKGIDVVTAYPTSDGYLKVGIRGHGDVHAAQSALDSMYGPGIIKVFGGAEPVDIGGGYVVTAPRGSPHAKHPNG